MIPHMEPALRRGFQFSDLEDELVHYTSSYTVTSFSFHPSEVWVKGFFLLVPHEEYETPTLHDYPMLCAPIVKIPYAKLDYQHLISIS